MQEINLTNIKLSGNTGGGGGSVDIINNLSSSRTDAALSANMGRTLKNNLDSSINEVKAEIPTVPTNVSVFNNDANYVNTSTLELGLDEKQDTLTAGTGVSIVDNVISVTLDTSVFEVCSELPLTDINPNKIYLVPAEDASVNNQYLEFLYVNDAWELVGQVKGSADLTNYYNKTEADARFISSTDARNIWIGTEAQYNAITEKSNTTVYLIK